MSMITERTFPSREVVLNLAAGPAAGPPLLLLHGVTRRWQDFVSLVPMLTPRWQVHALDFRGHGGSGRTRGHYLVTNYIQDALACLRTQLAEPAVVYGHSLGALVAAAAAAAAPDRVRAVVLEDPPAPALVRGIRATPFYDVFRGMQPLAGGRRPVPEVARELAEIRLPAAGGGQLRFGDLRDATSLRFTARCLQQLDPEVLTPILEGRWLDGHDPEAIAEGVRCPALLLRADETVGGMLPRDDARALVRGMADCTVIDLSGTGHLVHWLEPVATARYVLGFLESL